MDFKGNPDLYAKPPMQKIEPAKKTTCPFCLSFMFMARFLQSKPRGKGIDTENGRCPICGCLVSMDQLRKMRTITAVEYANFVFEKRRMFWADKQEKKNKPDWDRRLWMMEWNKDFWEEYNRLKEMHTFF